MLSTLCEEAGILIPDDAQELNALNNYVILVRYPGKKPTVEDAHDALRIAQSIRRFARKFMGYLHLCPQNLEKRHPLSIRKFSPERIIKAVGEQIKQGVHYYMAAKAEVKMAEKVSQLMPVVEMVRFVNTGSEATQMALRTARAFSKRDKVVKFEGNFHGQHEFVLVSTLGVSGAPEAPDPHIDSAGVPQEVASGLLILPYNDANYAYEQISKHASELGAVIVEPVSAFGLGVVPAEIEFLKALREVTTKFEIPLIYDEVVTNFRLGLGGASQYFSIQPDLVSLGKIIGGGFAVGGYGGKREIMERVVTPKAGLWDLSQQIFQSGCFSGNPVSMTAGLIVLEELEKGGEKL